MLGRAEHLADASDAVHVVFNNNARDFAPRAAERLRRRLGQVTVPAPAVSPVPAPAPPPSASKATGRLKQGLLF